MKHRVYTVMGRMMKTIRDIAKLYNFERSSVFRTLARLMSSVGSHTPFPGGRIDSYG